MTYIATKTKAAYEVLSAWSLMDVLGFARFFIMNGEDRLNELLQNR